MKLRTFSFTPRLIGNSTPRRPRRPPQEEQRPSTCCPGSTEHSPVARLASRRPPRERRAASHRRSSSGRPIAAEPARSGRAAHPRCPVESPHTPESVLTRLPSRVERNWLVVRGEVVEPISCSRRPPSPSARPRPQTRSARLLAFLTSVHTSKGPSPRTRRDGIGISRRRATSQSPRAPRRRAAARPVARPQAARAAATGSMSNGVFLGALASAIINRTSRAGELRSAPTAGRMRPTGYSKRSVVRALRWTSTN